ncbi:MAG: extracellular solute-binding protein [Cellulosilyticaceae bacterium]
MNKRLVASVLCALMLATAGLTGCSSKNEGTTEGTGTTTENKKEESKESAETGITFNEPGQFPIVTEKQEIHIVAPDTPYILDLNTNDFSVWYEEKTNVKVNYEQIPSESLTEKRNLMLASGNLPDAFMYAGFNKADEVTYGSQGIFLPLNDLIDQYGFYTKQVFDQQELLPAGTTAPDGNIYSLPRINECYHCMYSGKAWINQVWLDQLGLKYPETTDELITVLKAFKEKDPNGNGKADELGIVGSKDGWNSNPVDFIMNSFVYNDYGTRLMVKDGKVEFAAITEEWREGLKFCKQLYDEKLIDSLSITQTNDQMTSMANNPDEIIGVGIGATPNSTTGDNAMNRHKDYTPLSPLTGPNGARNALASPIGFYTGHFVITSSAKNPELVMRWADGLYNDEVTMISNYGLKDKRWKEAPEGSIGVDGEAAKWMVIKDENENPEQNNAMPNVALVNLTAAVRGGEALDPTDPMAPYKGEGILFSSTRDYYEPYAPAEVVPGSMYMLPEELDGFAQMQTQIADYITESMAAFVTGSRSIDDDKEWEKYKKELEALDLVRYLEIMQTGYDRTK